MAKVEELMSLMVEEINRYESLVKKMEKIQHHKIEIEVSQLKNFLKKHEAQMRENEDNLNQFKINLEKLIEDANIYPKWAVIIFIISITINCVLSIYLFI